MRLIHSRALAVATGALLALAGCSQDLNIPDTNAPDTKRALSTPSDVAALAASSIQTWQDASTEMNPNESVAVMADALTSSFNNFGMNRSAAEPRVAYPNNTTGGDYTSMVQDPWYNNYTALGEANDVLAAIGKGIVIDDAPTTESYKALAMLTQGLALGNISLFFDQGFVVDRQGVVHPRSVAVHRSVERTAGYARLKCWRSGIGAGRKKAEISNGEAHAKQHDQCHDHS